MERLDLADLVWIAAAATGQDPETIVSEIDAAKAEAALGAPFAGVVDVELFPTTEQKIAVLGYRLAKYHPLPDGNKRTAWFAMRFAADASGLAIRATSDEVVQAMKDVASGAMDEPAFHRWIASHIDAAP